MAVRSRGGGGHREAEGYRDTINEQSCRLFAQGASAAAPHIRVQVCALLISSPPPKFPLHAAPYLNMDCACFRLKYTRPLCPPWPSGRVGSGLDEAPACQRRPAPLTAFYQVNVPWRIVPKN